jgi:hypothetical protein
LFSKHFDKYQSSTCFVLSPPAIRISEREMLEVPFVTLRLQGWFIGAANVLAT